MTEKFEKKYDCGILNFWSSNNYGALLTCYALQESVKELGLVPGIINYHCRWEKFEGLLSDRFSRKYLDLTEPCADFEDLRRLNRQMQTFIAGSDQIWRYKYFWPRGKNIYQLSFASLNARKIAYAASFGLDRWEGGYENTLRTKYYMSRFDGISVREDDGVDICREVFGVRAEQVLDPVFLPEPGKWDLLIGNSSCRDEGYVTSYVLDQSPDTLRLVEYVCEKNGIGKTINLVNASKNEVDADVEDWLIISKTVVSLLRILSTASVLPFFSTNRSSVWPTWRADTAVSSRCLNCSGWKTAACSAAKRRKDVRNCCMT